MEESGETRLNLIYLLILHALVHRPFWLHSKVGLVQMIPFTTVSLSFSLCRLEQYRVETVSTVCLGWVGWVLAGYVFLRWHLVVHFDELIDFGSGNKGALLGCMTSGYFNRLSKSLQCLTSQNLV